MYSSIFLILTTTARFYGDCAQNDSEQGNDKRWTAMWELLGALGVQVKWPSRGWPPRPSGATRVGNRRRRPCVRRPRCARRAAAPCSTSRTTWSTCSTTTTSSTSCWRARWLSIRIDGSVDEEMDTDFNLDRVAFSFCRRMERSSPTNWTRRGSIPMDWTAKTRTCGLHPSTNRANRFWSTATTWAFPIWCCWAKAATPFGCARYEFPVPFQFLWKRILTTDMIRII